MHRQVSPLLSRGLRGPVPRVEGLEESLVGMAGRLVEGEVSIVPGGYRSVLRDRTESRLRTYLV
jgi:hypothetical protein